MPSFAYFFLGLAVGAGFIFWRQHQLSLKVRYMLRTLSDGADVSADLPAMALIRREFNRLNRARAESDLASVTWQNLLEQLPIGYLLVDEDNHLLQCNPIAQQWLKITRWQPGKVRLLLELVRSYDLDQLIERSRQSGRSQTRQWVYYYAQDFSGSTASNASTASGSPSNLISTPLSTNVIALKGYSYVLSENRVAVFLENQQSLVELTKSRDRALTDLTHELRTPLTAVGLLAERLQQTVEDPQASHWAGQLLQEIYRLSNLVQEWLELSRLNQDPTQHLNYQSFPLQELVLSVWQSLEPLAHQKELQLRVEAPDQLQLSGDRSRLAQVFLNLFDNGIKHSPPHTDIFVTVELLENNIASEENQSEVSQPQTPQPMVQISVYDWGAGFIPGDLPYVFQRLYKGDTSRTRLGTIPSAPVSSARSGSGLGLAIVQEIIQAHGGSIQANNHPTTGGAWLQFTLPLSPRTTSSAAVEMSFPHASP